MNKIVPDSLKDPRISTKKIKIGDLEFEIDCCGTGERLALFLHGFPEHSFSWRYQLPAIADLGYQAWAPNMRGYGNSSKPKGISSYSLDTLVEDIADIIEASGCKETVLIGHDWGAVVAWHFAIADRLPLTHLIICNVPHPRSMQQAFGWEQLKKSWYIFFFQIPRLPEHLLGKNNARGVGEMIRNTFVDPEKFPQEVAEVFSRNANQPGALTAMINYYRALRGGANRSKRKKSDFPIIKTPTLMIWGEEDVALSKETTYGTEQYVTSLEIRYLPKVSHWVQQESPDEVNAMMSAFINNEPVPFAS
ncbi:alpha/beta hydrolase [Gammaproteobacteria bacterium]|nr:alpha/beta hydrolase [Gammaproteobacteria bacterium]